MNMKVVITIGPDEVENGQAAVKDLLTGEQLVIPREAVADEIKRIL